MQQLMQKAVHYMQIREFVKALQLCEQMLKAGFNHPQVHMMQAIALANTSQFQKSQEIFKNLLKHFPRHPEIHYNFALTLQEQGEFEKAETHYIHCIHEQPNHPSALNNLATVQLKLNKPAAAQEHLKRALRLSPGNLEYKRNLANAHFQSDQHQQTIEILKTWIYTHSASASDYEMYLSSAYELRELIESDLVSQVALNKYSDNIKILNITGLLAVDNKKYKLAMKCFDACVDQQSDEFEFNFQRLLAQAHTGLDKNSLLEELLNLENTQAKTDSHYQLLAELAESFDLHDETQRFCEKSMKLNSNNFKAPMILARSLSASNKVQSGVNWMKTTLTQCKDEKLLAECHYQLARLFDKTADYNNAWEHIQKANQLNESLLSPGNPASDFLKMSDTLQSDYLKNHSKISNASNLKKLPLNLVFIVGFPRSGTTLLERVLNVHHRTKVLEETHCIQQIDHQLKSSQSGSYFENLSQLKDFQIENLRNQYIENLNQFTDWTEGDTVIDKMPMNGNHLALIHTLFPEAKILISLRHPLDVCISCLMQNMLQVFSIGSAAEVYSAYMTNLNMFLKDIPEGTHFCRYEDLINNFESEVKSVLNFLGLKWSEDMKQFHKQSSLANTPSFQQVNQPLYQSARYRFRNYLQFLDEALPILQPWLEAYNYQLSANNAS